ncbi:MAG: hypothetical protein HY744_09330 [Deltaproteobacteria bacterium]|nr:hypothetical protein [Deltaproteobacteria bacterium]
MSAVSEPEVGDEARALLEKLPLLLRQRPGLRQQLYDLLSEQYVTRREMAEVLAELKALRLDTNARFEAIDRRFEAMDRRFEALQAAMDRRFDQAEQRDRDTRDWVGIVVGGFQRRAGRSLEDAVAGTLRVALQMKDLDPATIKLRQKVQDREGTMGPAGRTEYDIFVSDGRACIFEVKSVPDDEDVERFADKCELVARELGLRDPRRVLVTLAKTVELARLCERRGIELA